MIIERGHGDPLVLVPGLQGRWEWVEPTLDALASSCRVLTFPLSGERASVRRLDGGYTIDDDVEQITKALDDRQIARAAICGISYGGLIALRFAAAHPDRTSALILASTPGPGFRLSPRHQRYIRAPLVFAPLFFLQSPFRVGAEILTALPGLRQKVRFVSWQLSRLLVAPLSPTRMARRAEMITRNDPVTDAAKVSAPTLVITGEPALDYVVSTAGTCKYLDLIPSARDIVIDRTGHLGSITKPHVFAAAVHAFLSADRRPQQSGYARGRAS